MDEVVLRIFEGTATLAERRDVQRWREAAPANEAKYREMLRLWEAIPATAANEATSPPPPVDALTARARWRPSSPEKPAVGRRPRTLRVAATLVAAAALIAVGFGASWLTRRPVANAVDEFATGPSGVSTVTLHDGSIVRLGPRTRLKVTGGTDDREVDLDGRGFFAVAHDPAHPFRIRTSAGTVTALGTRFDLQAEGENLSLALLEGHVVLSEPGREVSLHAGEAARVVAGTPLPLARIPDSERLMTWVGNFLAFQQTPLPEAMLEIERHYNMRITIADSTLANRTVTAWFADRNADEVLRIVCAATVAECVSEDGQVVVRSAH